MRRLAAVLLLLSPAYGSATAHAGGPVCRETSVTDEISREVRLQNHYGTIDPRGVSEYPTADPQVVVCQACVLLAPYDFGRFGDHPIRQCVARNFKVRIVTRGFIVSGLP